MVMEEPVSTNKKHRIEADMISSLPNALLLHILSFLPAKYAVATSLLSKRWKPLWCSLDTLDFNRNDFHNLPSFHQFTNKVLKRVDLESVKKFILDFSSNKPPPKTRKWINAIVSGKVEHLELHLRSSYELPSSVLIANTLRVLKLNGLTVNTFSHIDLPLLEVLHLKDVDFPDLRSLEKLLNSCPLLKDLEVRFPCRVDYHHPLNIERLNHLVSAVVSQSLIPLEAFSNATFLHFINQLGSSLPAEPILGVPSFVSLHLKEFTLCSFGGSESEFELIKFMLKNGVVLRTVYICAVASEYKIREFKKLATYSLRLLL